MREGRMQTKHQPVYAGSDLSWLPRGKAPSDMPAFQPYRGKPAVRNDREDRGNVGIIRSPVRASILPETQLFLGRRGRVPLEGSAHEAAQGHHASRRCNGMVARRTWAAVTEGGD